MKRLGLIAATAATVFLMMLHQDVGAATSSSNSAETYKQLNLFGDVFEQVRKNYVDDVSNETLVEGAINGMLTSLDPHSNYLNAKNFNDMKVQTRGEFGGLGIEVSMENGLVKVVSPIDDTPAAHAGLKPGDLITHIDGSPVQGMTLPEAVDKMRGLINTDITLTIRREGKEPFDVKLTRANIKIQSVKSQIESNNIGYIRITSFNEQTDVGLNNAMKNLKQQAGNNKLTGLVLDLRNNPGGLLDQAVAVSDDFLDKGEIVSTRGRRPDDAQRYNAHPGDIINGLPLAVLINGGSASASEIVAGALQDHHRAILLGTRSFGKGSEQTIIPLAGHGAMRLTTARYYTPSGRSIQAKGIDPDIVVEAAKIEHAPKSDNKTAQADKKDDKSTNKSDDKSADKKNDKSDANNPDIPPEQSTIDPSLIGTADDYQLARAVDMLRGI